MQYDPNINAIDNLTASCPVCASKGINRIWECGSMVVSGEFVQGARCEGEVRLVETTKS